MTKKCLFIDTVKGILETEKGVYNGVGAPALCVNIVWKRKSGFSLALTVVLDTTHRAKGLPLTRIYGAMFQRPAAFCLVLCSGVSLQKLDAHQNIMCDESYFSPCRTSLLCTRGVPEITHQDWLRTRVPKLQQTNKQVKQVYNDQPLGMTA